MTGHHVWLKGHLQVLIRFRVPFNFEERPTALKPRIVYSKKKKERREVKERKEKLLLT